MSAADVWVNGSNLGILTMPSNSRKVRGRRTEHVVAAYFQQYWEAARAVNSGASGSDVLGTPFMVEVKSRKDFNPLAWVKQNEKRDDSRFKFVVYRANGMGEDADRYLFICRLGDVMPFLTEQVPSEDIARCKGCGSWTIVSRICEVCKAINNNM